MVIVSVASWGKEVLRLIHTTRKNGNKDKFVLILDGWLEPLAKSLKRLYDVDCIQVNINKDMWNNKDCQGWKYGMLIPFIQTLEPTEKILFIENNYQVDGPLSLGENFSIGQGYVYGEQSEMLLFCASTGHSKENNNHLERIEEYCKTKGIVKLNNNYIINNEFKYPIENSLILEQRMFTSKDTQDQLRPTLTVYIPTRGRNDLTLPMAIRSVLTSSYVPDQLVIIDDNDEDKHTWIYQSIADEAKLRKILFYFMKGQIKGQIVSHELARKQIKSDYIFRMDDDNMLAHDTLGKLVEVLNKAPEAGATASTIINPKYPMPPHDLIRTDMASVKWGSNIQWHVGLKDKMYEAEHLYSCFMYRRIAATNPYAVKGKYRDRQGKKIRISKVGHREETIFSHGIFVAGWKLIVRTDTVMMHYASNSRYNARNQKYFDNDNKVFDEISEMRGVKFIDIIPVPMFHGLGDQYEFLRVLPELIEKYPDKLILLCTSKPEIFKDVNSERVKLITPIAFNAQFGDRVKQMFSVYAFMKTVGWKEHITEAYRVLFGIKPLPPGMDYPVFNKKKFGRPN